MPKKIVMRFLTQSSCIVLALLIVISALLGISCLSGRSLTDHSDVVATGLDYLKNAEAADASAGDSVFFQRKAEREKLAQQQRDKEQLIYDINHDNVDIYSLFKDYAILGDSRALGFSHFRYLDYSRVFAAGGDTILNVRDHIDKLKKLNPTYIYLCYGVNDAGIQIWKTPEKYAAQVLEILSELQAALPDSKIMLNSTIWISEGAARKFTPWAQIYDFSAACKVMCQENGFQFIDNDEICLALKENKWWSGDGIHLLRPFYKLWAKNMFLATLED